MRRFQNFLFGRSWTSVQKSQTADGTSLQPRRHMFGSRDLLPPICARLVAPEPFLILLLKRRKILDAAATKKEENIETKGKQK